MNDDQRMNTVDVGAYVGKLGLEDGDPGWSARLDLAQSPTGLLNTVDVGQFAGKLGRLCALSGP
jgi:hypothetical protein